MTQSELWLARWQDAVDFLETYHRKPSKFIPEERNMRSWWKHSKKLMNAGELKPERVELFKQLLELGEVSTSRICSLVSIFHELFANVARISPGYNMQFIGCLHLNHPKYKK